MHGRIVSGVKGGGSGPPHKHLPAHIQALHLVTNLPTTSAFHTAECLEGSNYKWEKKKERIA